VFTHPLFRIYPFDEVPLDRDVFLMDEEWLPQYEASLVAIFNGAVHTPVGYISYAAVRHIDEFGLEISWYPNIFDRFHEVTVTLPRDQFIVCVGCYEYDEKPHIFVKTGWLSNLHLRPYSVFALVDAIGVRSALARQAIDKNKLTELRRRIDLLAEAHLGVAFVSFADSLLLKSNYYVGTFDSDVKYTYEPEALVKLIPQISTLYAEVLGLRVYAAITQGLNEYYDDSLLHASTSGNHVSLNSLGLPFAQLLAIDEAARDGIRQGIHRPQDLYLDEHFYHSLRFRFGFDKHAQPSTPYRAPLADTPSSYFYCSLDTILGNLDPNIRLDRKGDAQPVVYGLPPIRK
jgi:hypothetical protein